MDGTYQCPQSENVRNGGYQQTQYSTAEQRSPAQPDLPTPQWASSPVYDGHPYGLRGGFTAPPLGGAGFGGPRFPPPYGYDPSVPPPPFGCPPSGHFSRMAPPIAVNAYSSTGVLACQAFPQQFGAGPSRYDRESESGCRQYEDRREGGVPYGGPSCPPLRYDRDSSGGTGRQAEDEEALLRRQDKQWLRRFLQSRARTSGTQKQQAQLISVPALRETLYGAAQLISRLEDTFLALEHNLHNDSVWDDCYLKALHLKRELQDKVNLLSDTECLDQLRAKVTHIAQRRARHPRARKELQMEEKQTEERSSEKEAAIDKWRMRQIQQVEEKKKEQELKLAADAVLCEVRKKQVDVKRMQDILRSLEKLRKLRKEAACRKGIVTEQPCDEAFSSRLEQLRSVMKRRTAVYSVEEKALMVMLEGEQEEERRREQERRAKKERERKLQRKRRVDVMLFGEEPPADRVLQSFREYYSQAEHSLQAVVQIRREWDSFLVAADHPDGSSVPQSWILPDPPSDQAWASALQSADTDCL